MRLPPPRHHSGLHPRSRRRRKPRCSLELSFSPNPRRRQHPSPRASHGKHQPQAPRPTWHPYLSLSRGKRRHLPRSRQLPPHLPPSSRLWYLPPSSRPHPPRSRRPSQLRRLRLNLRLPLQPSQLDRGRRPSSEPRPRALQSLPWFPRGSPHQRRSTRIGRKLTFGWHSNRRARRRRRPPPTRRLRHKACAAKRPTCSWSPQSRCGSGKHVSASRLAPRRTSSSGATPTSCSATLKTRPHNPDTAVVDQVSLDLAPRSQRAAHVGIAQS